MLSFPAPIDSRLTPPMSKGWRNLLDRVRGQSAGPQGRRPATAVCLCVRSLSQRGTLRFYAMIPLASFERWAQGAGGGELWSAAQAAGEIGRLWALEAGVPANLLPMAALPGMNGSRHDMRVQGQAGIWHELNFILTQEPMPLGDLEMEREGLPIDEARLDAWLAGLAEAGRRLWGARCAQAESFDERVEARETALRAIQADEQASLIAQALGTPPSANHETELESAAGRGRL